MKSVLIVGSLIAVTPACEVATSPPLETSQQAAPRTSPPAAPDGAPTCAGLGYGAFSYKLERPSSGTFDVGDGVNTVTISFDGLGFDWSATLGVDAVIVTGGGRATLYAYEPEQTSNADDPALRAPSDPRSEESESITQLELCIDHELTVEHTATASFQRTWSWLLDMSAAPPTTRLAPNQGITLGYSVAATRVPADSAWAVGGAITIANPAPMPAEITGVTAALAGVAVPADCAVSFPVTLARGGELACTYDLALAEPTNGTSVVEVATSGVVGPARASADVDFARARMSETDECATISEADARELGTTCEDRTYTYVRRVGPYATCGTSERVGSAARFVANDSRTTGRADATVTVATAPCGVGCTLTADYWATHAPPDDAAWLALSSAGAETAFFASDRSYRDVLQRPGTNGNDGLARAYIAATLNILGGAASTAEVDATLATAASYLARRTPAQVAAEPEPTRAQLTALAVRLDAYNQGTVGPGRCTH